MDTAPKLKPINGKPRYIPALLTISYSVLSAYLLASFSNKKNYGLEKEKQMFVLSSANGGLGGLGISKFFGLTYPLTFAHTILGYVFGGIYYQFSDFQKEKQIKALKKP